MKITYFIDSLLAGGKERQLYYLIQELSRGNEIQLIVFNDNIFFKEIKDLPIELILFPKNSRSSCSTHIIVYKSLKKFKPQIIHTWDNISQLIALPYILFNKVRVINGSIRYAGKIKQDFKNKLIKSVAFKTANKIISNSRQGLVVEKLHNSLKASFIYNGCQFNKDESKNVDLSKDVKNLLNRFRFNVVMVGRFYYAKDYITYIKAAKIVVSKDKSIGFYCIGEGPNKKNAEKESGKYLNKNIFFLGNRSDVGSILFHFDIGVLLSNTNGHAEGISNAIMEYMLSGIPVIATNAGGTPEIIKNDLSGFLISAFDEIVVANKIEELIRNEKLLNIMGKQGKRIVQEKFSIHKMRNAYLSVYKEIIA